jgi:EAL domain-containing protein (putative c-di-GMP-specific phosphodiesterase class I)/CheY-like chemotaxis protein
MDARPRLLILDDDPAIGRMVERIARRGGWRAQATTRAAGFQDEFRAEPPDAVFLDLQLADTDGIEQLRFLHQGGFTGGVALMSGVSSRILDATAGLGQSLGLAILATLSKPAPRDQLEAVLATLAQHRPGGAQPPADPTIIGAPLTATRVDEALARDELRLAFQPIVDLATREVAMFEALVRWDHPTHGVLLPDAFIPVTEQDVAVIDRLTRWVIDAGCRQARILREIGASAQVAVNVSAKNLRNLDFPDQIVDLVSGLGCPPSWLKLEITESAATGDPTVTKDILARLRLKGFRLAMDDFGTGFSSLRALLNSPFSELKIDKSFVASVLTSRDARSIVESVAHLAHDMGLKTIAEGVETQVVADALAGYGIDLIQGYLVSRPMAADAIPDWLACWAAA